MKKSVCLLLIICLALPVLAQVTARNTATLQVDADGNGKVTPGDTLRYTITITNTSSTNLLNVQFNDTAFSNQTLVAGSIKSTPVARPDNYNAIGNTLLTVTTASGVLANDSDPDGDSMSVAGFSPTSAHAGTVTMAGDGSFTYISAAGFTGTDTFTYSISDSHGGTSSSTVTLNVSNTVWYVNNAGANGSGTQSSPFNSLAGAAGASVPTNYIYVFQGTGNYTTGIALKNSQTLVGSGDALVVAGTTILSAGTRPTLLASSGIGVSLASNNIVHGINVGSSSGRAISGGSVANLVISNVIATATGGASVVLTNGTVNVTLDSATSSGSADNGIALNNISGSFVANGGSIGTAAATDFSVTAGNANVTYAGTINNTAGRSADINGITGGAVTLSGNVTDTGTGIIVQNCTGGTTTFSGGSKSLNTGANTAVTLSSNTGHTINFSNGGLAITTTSTGFSATGGATAINVTGAGNTINSGTATALNVASTTIGASGLTFQSISSSGGTATGIILDTTGANAGLTVTGTGSAGSGGTIASKTGADGSTTTGVGIYLNNTLAPSFSWMQLNDFQNYGIYGTTVNGFSMTHCTVSGVNGTSASGIGEGSVYFTGLSGSAGITNCNVSGAKVDNFHVFNDSAQTLNRITLDTVALGTMDAATGNDALTFEGTGGMLNVTVRNTTITSARGDLFQINMLGTLACDLVFSNNTLINSHPNIVSGGGGVTLGGGGAANNVTFTYNISSNIIKGAHGATLAVFKGTGTGANFNGTIARNVIGTQGVAGSGSTQGDGISVFQDGAGTVTTTIFSNHVSGVQATRGGIDLLVHNGASGEMQATVQGNTVDTLDQTNAFAGIYAQTGSNTGGAGDNNKSCLTLGGAGALKNNIDAGANTMGAIVAGIVIEQEGVSRIGLLGSPNYSGGVYSDANVQTYVGANTTFTGNNAQAVFAFHDSTSPSGGGYFGSCPP